MSTDKEPSWTDRIYGAGMSGNPDVHSSLSKKNPGVGERAVASGFLGVGVDLGRMAEQVKKST